MESNRYRGWLIAGNDDNIINKKTDRIAEEAEEMHYMVPSFQEQEVQQEDLMDVMSEWFLKSAL